MGIQYAAKQVWSEDLQMKGIRFCLYSVKIIMFCWENTQEKQHKQTTAFAYKDTHDIVMLVLNSILILLRNFVWITIPVKALPPYVR